MTKQDRTTLKKLEHELNKLSVSDDLTPEAEDILDRIAWYCVLHNISIEEYDKLIKGV